MRAEPPRPKPVPPPKNEFETEQDWRNAMMRLRNRVPDERRDGPIADMISAAGSGRGKDTLINHVPSGLQPLIDEAKARIDRVLDGAAIN